MTRYILGIDPGLHGALAFYDPAADALHVHDMPTLVVAKAGKNRTVINEPALAQLIDNCSQDIGEAWLEQVGTRPGEGAVGAFTFGRVYGLIRGVLVANFIRVHDVTPQVWKKALRVTGDKDESRLRASHTFPKHTHLWPLKKHDGRAEAALIARYGALQKTA